MARTTVALIALAVLAACSGDDAEPTANTTSTSAVTSTTTSTTTTGTTIDARPAALEAAWSRAPSPATSCLVVADRDGDFVFAANPDLPVVPASTIKLLVAAAAPDDPRIGSMLGNSDNDAARSIVDDLGGVDAVADALVAQSRPMAGVEIRDATGHDRGNRLTCRLLVAILAGAPDAIRDALPAAGTGTLRDRYVEHAGRLRAKTGSIRGVGALAGYADELTFALVLNDAEEPLRAQDAVVEALLP